MEDSDSWWREKVRLVDFSSQVSGCPATNVLDSRPDKLWLTEPGLPQWICLALDEVENAERGLPRLLCGGKRTPKDRRLCTLFQDG